MATLVESKNMDELWLDINDRILWATADELAYASSLDTMLEDCLFTADNCKYTLNMGEELWLTPTRWTTLVNQYIDPTNLMNFLDSIKEMGAKGRGVAAMDMKQVKMTRVDGSPRASRRKHGGCMRFMTWRNYPEPTISLYSRTSYLGYIGGLDMMVAHKIARLASTIKNIHIRDIRFRWHVEMAQFHGFKSMSFIFTSSDENLNALTRKIWNEKFYGPVENYPTWKLVRYWYQRLQKHDREGLTYDDMKYGAEIRIRRRMHGFLGVKDFGGVKTQASEPLDVPIKSLSLDRLLTDYELEVL